MHGGSQHQVNSGIDYRALKSSHFQRASFFWRVKVTHVLIIFLKTNDPGHLKIGQNSHGQSSHHRGGTLCSDPTM
jgi:hypothetical protein